MICESRLQQIVHTVKFTKLANMIILKRSFTVQSQELLTAYTRPHVRIVSSYFNDNFKIKQNTTMNVNRNQKHGPILHYITKAKSRTTNIREIHYHKENKTNGGKQIVFSAESNQFEKKNQK